MDHFIPSILSFSLIYCSINFLITFFDPVFVMPTQQRRLCRWLKTKTWYFSPTSHLGLEDSIAAEDGKFKITYNLINKKYSLYINDAFVCEHFGRLGNPLSKIFNSVFSRRWKPEMVERSELTQVAFATE